MNAQSNTVVDASLTLGALYPQRNVHTSCFGAAPDRAPLLAAHIGAADEELRQDAMAAARELTLACKDALQLFIDSDEPAPRALCVLIHHAAESAAALLEEAS